MTKWRASLRAGWGDTMAEDYTYERAEGDKSVRELEAENDELRKHLVAYIENSLDYYQGQARSTAFFPEKLKLEYLTIALAGEAGEIAEKVKKIIRDKGSVLTDEDKAALALELGDVLWYVAVFAANICNWPLSEVAAANLRKLESRKERGTLSGSGNER